MRSLFSVNVAGFCLGKVHRERTIATRDPRSEPVFLKPICSRSFFLLSSTSNDAFQASACMECTTPGAGSFDSSRAQLQLRFCSSPLLVQGGLFATFGGNMIDPLVVKHSLVEGVANFLTKGGKENPPAPVTSLTGFTSCTVVPQTQGCHKRCLTSWGNLRRRRHERNELIHQLSRAKAAGLFRLIGKLGGATGHSSEPIQCEGPTGIP